jgi:hypothetical protein
MSAAGVGAPLVLRVYCTMQWSMTTYSWSSSAHSSHMTCGTNSCRGNAGETLQYQSLALSIAHVTDEPGGKQGSWEHTSRSWESPAKSTNGSPGTTVMGGWSTPRTRVLSCNASTHPTLETTAATRTDNFKRQIMAQADKK